VGIGKTDFYVLVRTVVAHRRHRGGKCPQPCGAVRNILRMHCVSVTSGGACFTVTCGEAVPLYAWSGVYGDENMVENAGDLVSKLLAFAGSIASLAVLLINEKTLQGCATSPRS
jgi:hypothetical protein